MNEITDTYRIQRKRAMRYVSDHKQDEWNGLLPVLDVELPNRNELNALPLGVIEVPISKIRGTVAAGRASAFAGNFLPLLPDNTEFASKWTSLYSAHMESGIRDACIGLEYLGFYYILEGHKRVSVLNAVDAPTVHIDVTRVMPSDDLKSTDADIYREFLAVDSRIALRDLWFSLPGSFTALYEMSMNTGTPKPEDALFDAYADFRICYKELELDNLPITTGDALLAYSRVYGLPYNSDSVTITANLKAIDPDNLAFLYSPIPLEGVHFTFYENSKAYAFVIGALAGSLSFTNRIVYDGPDGEENFKSFSEGAKMVNAHVEVIYCGLGDPAGEGADMAFLPFPDGNGRGPAFPGVFARLAGLTPRGYVNEYYAAVSRHFDAFYKGAPREKSFTPLPQPFHAELGLDSGFLRLHLNEPVLTSMAPKLVKLLKTALA